MQAAALIPLPPQLPGIPHPILTGLDGLAAPARTRGSPAALHRVNGIEPPALGEHLSEVAKPELDHLDGLVVPQKIPQAARPGVDRASPIWIEAAGDTKSSTHRHIATPRCLPGCLRPR